MRTIAPDLVVVFNICGIAGKPNLANYIRNIRNLHNQTDVAMELVISSCENTHADLKALQREFGNTVSYFITQETLTVNVTFNKACERAAKEFGMPLGFLYVDSGCDVGSDQMALHRLLGNHKSGAWGMTAALVDRDTGFDLWRPGMSEGQLFSGELYKIPVGQTCNLHFQIFDRTIVEAFGRPIPDVFRDFCTESVFSFMCAAVGADFGVWRNVRVVHDHGMDGGASGFAEDRGWRSLLLEAPRRMEEIIADPEALASGFGYEECEKILMHNPGLYDKNGIVKDQERLRRFISANLFLAKDKFDYDKITHAWIPAGKDFNMVKLPDEPKVPDISAITNRSELGDWLNAEGLTGEFAEIGVAYGAFASTVLDKWKGARYYMVDLWKSQPANVYLEVQEAPDRYETWWQQVNGMAGQDPRIALIRKDSVLAARDIPNKSLDGVFIDANHAYGAVLADLDAWWPKVKRRGLFCGHDFYDTRQPPHYCEVKSAVERWMRERGVVYRVTECSSWWAIKRW